MVEDQGEVRSEKIQLSKMENIKVIQEDRGERFCILKKLVLRGKCCSST